MDVVWSRSLFFLEGLRPLAAGEDSTLCAQAARRCPGLELSPVTEKIIKNRTRGRQLSSSLRGQSVAISGFSRNPSAPGSGGQ